MATRHIADAEDDFYVINITPDFCRVGDSIVAFDIYQVHTPEECDYAKKVYARGCKVLMQSSVIKGVVGDAGAGVTSDTSLETGDSKIIQGANSVLTEGRPTARHQDLVFMNGHDNCGPYNCLGMLITDIVPLPPPPVMKPWKPDPWDLTKKTIKNSVFKGIGNLPKESANAMLNLISDLFHMEKPIPNLKLDFPYDNEIEEEAARDVQAVVSVGTAIVGGGLIRFRKRSRGTIDRGRQNIHIDGTNENKVRKTQSSQKSNNPTEWKDPSQADELTHQAYEYGDAKDWHADGSPSMIEHDFGHPVGANGETKVKVHIKKNGQYHGVPSGEKSGN